VSPLKPAHLMEGFQVFANRDQGSREAPRKVLDHHPAVTLGQLENFSSPLFCQHLYQELSIYYFLLLF
jgi:hypothetical protein